MAIEGTTSYAVSGLFFIRSHLKSVPFFSFELVHITDFLVPLTLVIGIGWKNVLGSR